MDRRMRSVRYVVCSGLGGADELSGRMTQQLDRLDIERGCQTVDIFEADVALAALAATDKGAIETSLPGQLFLG